MEELAAVPHNDPDLEIFRTSTRSLTYPVVPLSLPPATVPCKMSTGTSRPFAPLKCRRPLCDHLHSNSHRGYMAPQQLVISRYFWRSMSADARRWEPNCLPYQRVEVARHIVSPASSFRPPDSKRSPIRLELVGPVPSAGGVYYLLACVDRFAPWPIGLGSSVGSR